MHRFLRRIAILVLALCWAVVGWCQPSPEPSNHVSDDQYERILIALRIRNRPLPAPITAIIGPNSKLLIPIQSFSASAGLSVDESSAGLVVRIPGADRSLTITSPSGLLTISGVATTQPPALTLDGEPHVDVDVVASWLKAEIFFSYTRLELSITPEFELPIERALAAQRGAAFAATGRGLRAPPSDLRARQPGLFSIPTVDFSMNSSRQSDDRRFDQRLNLFATMDLLSMNARISSVGDFRSPFEAMRFQLSRTSDRNALLGDLRARSFAIGDVWTGRIPFVSTSKRGRGFEISSFPTYRSADLNETTIIGNSVPGWRAELYRDGLLIDSGVVDEFGAYRFVRAPLVVGENKFTIVTIGPNGETRSEERKQVVGYGSTRPGETNYRAIAMQEYDDGSRVHRGWRGLAEFDHALSYQTALTGRTIVTGPRNYYSLGARQNLGDSLGSLDVISTSDGGWGSVASLQTRLGDKNLSAGIGVFSSNFISEATSARVRVDANVRLDAPIRLPSAIPLFSTLSLRYREFADRKRQFQLSNRITGAFAGLSVSNHVNVRGDSFADQSEWGRLTLRKSVGSYGLRGELGYAFDADFLRSAAISADFGRSQAFRMSAGIKKVFRENSDLFAFTTLTRNFSTGKLGIDLQVNREGRLFGSLTFSTSFGSDPRTGAINLLPDGSAATGLVSIRLFVDANENGVFDAGDRPVGGAKFRMGRRELVGVTNELGLVTLAGFSPSVPVEISVDLDSISSLDELFESEPFWVIPTVGAPTRIDAPIRILKSTWP